MRGDEGDYRQSDVRKHAFEVSDGVVIALAVIAG